jgi:hypothetical protein
MPPAHRSRYMDGGAARIIRPPAASTTDLVKQAVADELERQRGGIDGVKGLRAVAIKVHLPPMPAVVRDVVVSMETGR